jgi:hypothetical protein
MQRLVPPRLPAMLTLRHRPSLSLDLEQRPFIVRARGRSVALDAGRAGVFLVVDEDHCNDSSSCGSEACSVSGDTQDGL